MDNIPNRHDASGRYIPKHGLYDHPFYPIWSAMMSRCENPNNESYSRYGARGIAVCDEWKDVVVFIEWLEDNGYKKGFQIDRKDNDLGYSPGNCQIVTPQENCRNRRDNKRYLVRGEMLLGIEVQEKYGIKESTFRARVDRYGQTPEEALNNKRKLPVYSHMIHGKLMSIEEICRKFGISRNSFNKRIAHGWSAERAAFSPVRKYRLTSENCSQTISVSG